MYTSISKRIFRRIIIPVLVLLTGVLICEAKPLSEKDRLKLSEIARTHYNMTMMDGASMLKFKSRNILLVIVDVKNSANAQRVGQVKASRTAGEFLQAATNKSITVFEVSDGSSYSMQDEGSEKSSTSGNKVGGKISQATEDFSTSATEERFSDKIIQSSITRVGHIEPLCRIGSDGNNITFAYFLIIEK